MRAPALNIKVSSIKDNIRNTNIYWPKIQSYNAFIRRIFFNFPSRDPSYHYKLLEMSTSQDNKFKFENS